MLANAHPYLPQTMGGAQSSMHDLAGEFARRGHEVSVLGGLTKQGWVGLKSRVQRKLQRRRYSLDHGLGYPVYRAWDAGEVVADVARHMGADVVVPQSWLPIRFAQALRSVDTRVVIYLRNVEVEELGGDPRDLQGVSYVANSQFTAARWKELLGIESEVVYPLIRRENYETETTRDNVTFINPYPKKGLEIALGVAERCPEIPFVFVESWRLHPENMKQLRLRLALLPNVTLKPRTRDMKSIYGKARVVLAPSQWEEAFGRIAVEAHYSGIPVVASARGGLPEAVGPGGILMEPVAGADAWAKAVRKLWHDQVFYAEKSNAARDYSMRPEMNRTEQIDKLLEIFSGATRLAAVSG
nr:glycosyltransferase [Paracoccus sp. MC1862]